MGGRRIAPAQNEQDHPQEGRRKARVEDRPNKIISGGRGPVQSRG